MFADEIIVEAEKISDCSELLIAKSFVLAESRPLSTAICNLIEMETSSSRSAALTLSAVKTGTRCALNWFHDTGFAPTDLDGEGMALLLQMAIENEEWDTVAPVLEAVSDETMDDTPCLISTSASAHLCLALEPELRLKVLGTAPFISEDFPLSAEVDAQRNAEKAKLLFSPNRDHIDLGSGCIDAPVKM